MSADSVGGASPPIDSAPGPPASRPAQFARRLTTFDLTNLGIGGIIGAGIFVLSGHAAARYAGPAVAVSFMFSGFGCLLCGLAYSELASMIPVAGSAYSYATATLGGIAGWLIGWDLILEYTVGAATVSVGWSGYTCSILKDLGAACPAVLSSAPLARNASGVLVWSGALCNAPAAFIAIALTAVAVSGVQQSARITNILVCIKIGVLLLFLISGVGFVKKANWSPFFVPEDDRGRFGWWGLLSGSSVVFFSFIGFDAISTACAEAVDPQKSIPRATMGALGVCTTLYVLVALVLTGLVPYPLLDAPDPIAVAVDAAGPGLSFVRPIIKVGAITGLTSVILVLINGQARITHAMASDGLLPPSLSAVDERTLTPSRALLWAGGSAAALAAFFPIDLLGEMVSIGTLAAFAFVCVGVLLLRRTKPDLPRPFSVPYSPWVPGAGATICVIQMLALPFETWLRLIVWMVIGGAVYQFYSRHHMLPIEERVKRLLGEGGRTTLSSAEHPSPVPEVEAMVAARRGAHVQLVDW